jgi:hypothetical protein
MEKSENIGEPVTPIPASAAEPPPHPDQGKPDEIWTYQDQQGQPLFQVCRFNTPSGKKISPRSYWKGPDGKEYWAWKALPAPRPLYGLDRLSKRPKDIVLLTEGEKAADAAASLFPEYVTITSPGGSNAASKADWSPLRGRNVIIWPDHDQPGRKYARTVAEQVQATGAKSVRIVQVPDEFPDTWDLADPCPDGWSPERLRKLLKAPEATSGLVVIDLQQFLTVELPQRENIIDPVLPTQGLVMVFGFRGTGKTFFALTMAYGVASGGELFGRWTVKEPRRILYIDGEMPAKSMQDRLARIKAGSDTQPEPGFFNLITPDLIPFGHMPNLATSEGQSLLEPHLHGIDLIVVDNLATLARAGRENEAESWLPVQGWLLAQRRAGRSVLLVHHAGKGGDQRGTSSREDILDTTIRLSRPTDYNPTQGARFMVDLTKARGVTGEDAEPFEARLIQTPESGLAWEVCSVEDRRISQVAELKDSGMSIRDIAAELGMAKSTVARLAKKSG